MFPRECPFDLILLVVLWLAVSPLVYGDSGRGITMENAFVAITLDESTGFVRSLRNKVTGAEYLSDRPTELATLMIDYRTGNQWEAVPRRALRLNRPVSGVYETTANAQMYTVTYYDTTYDIKTVITLTLGEDPFVGLQAEIENGGPATVVRLDFPHLRIARAPFPDDRLVWPYREGQIIPTPRGENEILYPGNASMQWFQYGSRSEGVYVAVYDESAAYKSFRRVGLPKEMEFRVSLWPFVEPGRSWVSPPVEIGVAAGEDWYWAADRYRRWLVEEARWVRDLPDWVAEMTGFGVQFVVDGSGHVVVPFAGLPAVAEGVTARGGEILEIKGWHTGGFDTFYPEYVPSEAAGGRSALAAATERIAAQDVKLLFYMNSRIANKSTPWYQGQRQTLDAVDAFGRTVDERWNDYTFSAMCPAARGWQDTLLEHQRDLVAMGGRGMFFDQTGAMPPLLCYNEGHGHTSPATAFSEGHREMFDRFHELWSDAGTYLFITEGVADYLGSLTHLHGLVWARPFGSDPFQAPQVARYVLPTKLLGLPEAGRPRHEEAAYFQAYLLGAPFLDLPVQTRRLQALYRKEPDVFFRGRFLDERGIRHGHEHLRTALHVSANSDRAVLILWNDSDTPVAGRLSVDLSDWAPFVRPDDLVVTDLETDESITVEPGDGRLVIHVPLQAGQLRTLRIRPKG